MKAREIRELRQRFRLTQGEFATAVGGIHYTTVSRWERGTTTPTPRDISRLMMLASQGIEQDSQNNEEDRSARVSRDTAETQITLTLVLDGTGQFDGDSCNGMLNHLLAQIARHGLFDLSITATADLSPGWHHLVEDVAVVLGRALRQAIGDGKGIVRMGHSYAPLDETLAFVAIDLSGRPYAMVHTGLAEGMVGDVPADLIRHFLEVVALESRSALHAKVVEGMNPHHKAEALFKALARALRQAVAIDSRAGGKVPSTKDTINN